MVLLDLEFFAQAPKDGDPRLAFADELFVVGDETFGCLDFPEKCQVFIPKFLDGFLCHLQFADLLFERRARILALVSRYAGIFERWPIALADMGWVSLPKMSMTLLKVSGSLRSSDFARGLTIVILRRRRPSLIFFMVQLSLVFVLSDKQRSLTSFVAYKPNLMLFFCCSRLVEKTSVCSGPI